MRTGRLLFKGSIVLATMTICVAQNSKTVNPENILPDLKYTLEDFTINLNSILSPPNHIWVMSGWSTVAPVPGTVMGVGDCFGPPLAGRDFKLVLTIEANGHPVKDAGSTGKGDVGLLYSGGTWRPDRICRNGTYHFLVKDDLISFSVQSELIPLFNRTGFLLKIILKNRTKESLNIRHDRGTGYSLWDGWF